QALNLLNDPVFFEAAQALAARMVKEGGREPKTRIVHGFRLCTARRPSDSDLADLLALYKSEKARIAREHASASVLEGFSGTPAEASQQEELAAWTMVANVLLNLDETQTKE